MKTLWREVAKREDLVDGVIAFKHGPKEYQGNIEEITLNNNTATIHTKNMTRKNPATGGWIPLESGEWSRVEIPRGVPPTELPGGRITCTIPSLGELVLTPKEGAVSDQAVLDV